MTIHSTDSTNRKNLLLLIQLRWLAVGGQVFTILVVHYWLGIDLPRAEMAFVILFLVALNIVGLLRFWLQREVSKTELFLELLLDVAALTIQLYLSGGASNPFISLYLLQVILGAVLLEAWATWTLAVITSACFIWLTVGYRDIAMPHAHGSDFFNLHIQGMFICFILAASLLVLFVTRINRNLRARDEHLARLRQQSAEEDLIVRMGLLASGAAHELGTPLATLSVILGDWRRMPVFQADPDVSAEMVEMQSQLDRCKAIVSGILLSSGEARGEGTVRSTVIDFMAELRDEWTASRSPQKLDYFCDFHPDTPIISDAVLKQVIFNLLDNALEASPAWLSINLRREDDTIMLTISDGGPGFAPEILAELGRPYRSTRDRPGSGLGLFLVVNVMRKLGGRLKAQNRAEGGASVSLTLPLAALRA
jgi:two-component system sensor histidine kinase RegB